MDILKITRRGEGFHFYFESTGRVLYIVNGMVRGYWLVP